MLKYTLQNYGLKNNFNGGKMSSLYLIEKLRSGHAEMQRLIAERVQIVNEYNLKNWSDNDQEKKRRS